MIDYEYLIQKSLLSVVKDALNLIAVSGPKSGCHILITFLTEHPKVKISNRVKQQYPQKMMIVLQHSFWDLKADDEGIYVSLSFSSIPENIFIPYEALIGYHDAISEFGLQFAEDPDKANDDSTFEQTTTGDYVDEQELIVHDNHADVKRVGNINEEIVDNDEGGRLENEQEDIVVSLDKFRKK